MMREHHSLAPPRATSHERMGELQKALRGTYDKAVWHHLADTTSAPFEAGQHEQIAVKVIDDRGNELLAVKDSKE